MSIFTFLKSVWTKYNDFVYNIETIPDVSLDDGELSNLQGEYSERSTYNDNIRYESPDYYCIRKVARVLNKSGKTNGIFYDLGSGKGRVLCVMAQKSFKKIVGVELFENLCEVAKQNVNRLRWRKAPIDIICSDAASTDISEGTVYFMYHPFGPKTMRDVILNIGDSLLRNPRKITIVYYNAVHDNILKSCGWLHKYYQFYTATGRSVSFWENY